MLSYDENTINQYIQNNHYNFEKFIDMYSTDIYMDVLYKRLSRVRSKFKKLWIESGNGEEDVYDSGK